MQHTRNNGLGGVSRRFAPCAVFGLVAAIAASLYMAPKAGAQDGKIIHRRDAPQLSAFGPIAKLGKRLFFENRLSNPGSQFLASCAACHQPPDRGRAYADREALSLIPSSRRGRKLTTVRNTPTLLDVARMDRLNHDGQYASLERLIEDKLTGVHMGWLPEDRQRALDEIHALMLNDVGEDENADGSYIENFKAVHGVDFGAMNRGEIVAKVVLSLAEYVRTLGVVRSAPYDSFTYLNRINEELTNAEDPKAFAGRLFGRLANQEGRMLVKFPVGYNEDTYQGMKMFYRTDGTERVGNCVSCHEPPYFTDFGFHNTGVAQEAYDEVHGEGRFSAMALPRRGPGAATRARPSADDPAKVDLGRWNWAGETTRASALGAFKTPALRELRGTDPYLHDGAYPRIEDVIRQKIRAATLARQGKLRNADEELKRIYLTEDDVKPLVLFLETLNEVDPVKFRELVVRDVKIREAGLE